MIKKCKVCEKEFLFYSRHKDRQNEGDYCSRTCFFKSRNKRQTVLCLNCGKEKQIKLYVYNSNAGKRFFCNIKCKKEYYSKNIIPKKWNIKINEEDIKEKYLVNNMTMAQIGKEYSVSTNTIKRLLIQYGIKIKTANDYIVGESFSAVTRRLLKKFNNSCQICGWNLDTCDIHHIVARKDGGTNEDKNLIVVCPNHHRLLQHNKIKI